MKIIADFDLSALLVTRSEQGMTLLQPGRPPRICPLRPRKSVMLPVRVIRSSACWRRRWPPAILLEEACYFANAAAGVVVGKLGTSPFRLSNWRTRCAGARDRFWRDERRRAEAGGCRGASAARKMVMTNGVFDILHAGHVSYLANARKLGDRLIVAVNSDASTRRLKGDSLSTRWISG